MDSITRNPTDPSGLLFRFNIVYSNIAAQHFSAFALLIFLGMPAFLEQTGPAAVPNHGLSEQTRQRHYSRAVVPVFPASDRGHAFARSHHDGIFFRAHIKKVAGARDRN
jgi:hypothetical protein